MFFNYTTIKGSRRGSLLLLSEVRGNHFNALPVPQGQGFSLRHCAQSARRGGQWFLGNKGDLVARAGGVDVSDLPAFQSPFVQSSFDVFVFGAKGAADGQDTVFPLDGLVGHNNLPFSDLAFHVKQRASI